MTERRTKETNENQKDLQHFLKLALALTRNRMRQDASDANEARSLRLLEDLIKEQVEAHENSVSAASASR